MDTENIRTFLALARLKNFTQTARQLYVAQSTVTNRIVELERELGKRLFSREKRQVELTPEGEIFLEYAKRMMELEEISFQKVNAVSHYDQNLRIGTTNTIYESYLADSIFQHRLKNPNISLKVVLGHSEDLLKQLQDGVLDVAYTYVPLYKPGFQCEIFHKETLVLVTAFDNEEYVDGMAKEDLVHVDYLMCNFMLQEVGAFIRELFPPYYQFSFEIDNCTKLVPYLLEGSGYSFLPQKLAEPWVANEELRVIPLLDFQSPVISSYWVKREKNAALHDREQVHESEKENGNDKEK